ncbi:MAG TPA: metalloregulator ArsR/SmtB family transcription factor [Thermoanaerobaculia bacterium]|nr:metalloregulator ArsR/SmtB family transcription factor [Thermoanaerobaculia bacterium]HUM30917.1 metalloregulator ArsR/SmtB family transcription factor [Thermoanaerobaculia bacterium]HXK69250.1 metalloregulator ArsR/SmtB family transcription factor [Thermoanaerobaculia bacterium]
MNPWLLDRLPELMKALSHPIRIRILEIVSKGKNCQCELAGLLNEHPVNISRHMNVLVQAGLVELEKEGTKTIPHLLYPEIIDLMDEFGQVIKKQARDQVRIVHSSLTK